MKRIEITTTKKESIKNDSQSNTIYYPKNILSLDEEEELRSITIGNLYQKISNNSWRRLSRTEIMYLYNIYNIRWLSDMETKYDNDSIKDGFYEKNDETLGPWPYKEEEKEHLRSMITILHNYPLIKKEHLASFYGCSQSAIAMTEKELKSNPEKYVCLLGDLNIGNTTVYSKLKFVSGSVTSTGIRTMNGLPNLEYIGVSGGFNHLDNTVGLEKLIAVGGNLYLDNAINAEGLVSLTSVFGNFDITTAKSIGSVLNNLCYIGGILHLDNLKDLKGLENLRCVLGDIYINQDASLGDLKHLEYVGGFASNGRVKVSNLPLKTKIKLLKK